MKDQLLPLVFLLVGGVCGDAGEEQVGEVDDPFPASEVLPQEDPRARLFLPGGICKGILVAQENIRVGVAEAIDGLLHVSHHEAVLAV